jgi:O-antigen/teichoic acid export membrane protein
MIAFVKRKFHNLVSDQKFSEILTGSAYALIARVVATLLEMIISIIIARFYGAEAMGIVAVLNSFLLLATIFTVLGTTTSLLRLIPEHMVKYSTRSAFGVYRKTQLLVLGVSLVSGALFFWGSGLISDKVFSKPHLSFYFALAAVFVVFKSLMLLTTQAVRGLRLIRAFAFMQALPHLSDLVLLVLLTLFFYTRDNPVYAYLSSLAVTGIVGGAIMEVAFRRRIKPNDPVEPLPTATILSISLPMLMSMTMNFAVLQAGVIMLGMLRTEAEVGYYAVAAKLANVTGFVLSAINSMAGPRFSELFYSGKMDELFHVAKKSSKLIFWTTAPILLALILFGKPVLSLLFGKEFTVAYAALVFLTIGQFINSISGSTAMFMNMTGHQESLTKIFMGAAMLNIIVNLLLIPPLGIIGSAVAGMGSLAFWNICVLVFIKQKYGRTIGYFVLPIGPSK